MLIGKVHIFHYYNLNPTLAPALRLGLLSVVMVHTPSVRDPISRYWAAAPTTVPPDVERPTRACTDYRPSVGGDEEVMMFSVLLLDDSVDVVSLPPFSLPDWVTAVVTLATSLVPGT